MSDTPSPSKERPSVFSVPSPPSYDIYVNTSKAQFSSVLGAIVFGILNIGHYIYSTNDFNRLTFSFDLSDYGSIIAFTLLVLGPVYSWMLVRLTRVHNVALGFYIGMSTVALFQSFGDFYRAVKIPMGHG
jgi:hypothetical protein